MNSDFSTTFDSVQSMNQLTTGEVFAIFGGILLFIFFILVIVYIYFAICLIKIAKKTDTPDAWMAWIPIINIVLMLNIAKKPLWWIIWFFVPFANIVVYILVWMRICKALGKQEWLGILMIISPINLIIQGYLAFSQKTDTQSQTQTVNVSL